MILKDQNTYSFRPVTKIHCLKSPGMMNPSFSSLSIGSLDSQMLTPRKNGCSRIRTTRSSRSFARWPTTLRSPVLHYSGVLKAKTKGRDSLSPTHLRNKAVVVPLRTQIQMA